MASFLKGSITGPEAMMLARTMTRGANVEVTMDMQHRDSAWTQCHGGRYQICIPSSSLYTKDTLDILRGYLDHEVGHVLFTDFDRFAAIQHAADEAHMQTMRSCMNIAEDIRIERRIRLVYPGAGKNIRELNRSLFTYDTARQAAEPLANAYYAIGHVKGTTSAGSQAAFDAYRQLLASGPVAISNFVLAYAMERLHNLPDSGSSLGLYALSAILKRNPAFSRKRRSNTGSPDGTTFPEVFGREVFDAWVNNQPLHHEVQAWMDRGEALVAEMMANNTQIEAEESAKKLFTLMMEVRKRLANEFQLPPSMQQWSLPPQGQGSSQGQGSQSADGSSSSGDSGEQQEGQQQSGNKGKGKGSQPQRIPCNSAGDAASFSCIQQDVNNDDYSARADRLVEAVEDMLADGGKLTDPKDRDKLKMEVRTSAATHSVQQYIEDLAEQQLQDKGARAFNEMRDRNYRAVENLYTMLLQDGNRAEVEAFNSIYNLMSETQMHPSRKPGSFDRWSLHPLSDNQMASMKRMTTQLSSAFGQLMQTMTTVRSGSRTWGSRPDGRYLYRPAVMDGRIFTSRAERPKLYTDVAVLLDLSSSMTGTYIEEAHMAAQALLMSLRSLPHMRSALYGYAGGKTSEGVVKFVGFDDKWKLDRRIPQVAGSTPTGASMFRMLEVFDNRPDVRRIVLVVTDGEADNNHAVLAALNILENRNIECYSIGLNTQAVKSYMDENHCIVVEDVVKELAPAMRTLLTRAMKNDKRRSN